MSTHEHDLTWIVVSHRSGDDLARLLPTLRRAIDAWTARGFATRLVVADAGSPDDTPARVRALDPLAEVHVEPDNRGFGATANAAVSAAAGTSPWLAVSNADLVVPDGGLARLPEVLAGVDARVGLLGPRLLTPDGEPDAWTGGVAPSLGTLVRRLHATTSQDETDVEWLTGACLFVRRAAWRDAGGFDEGFFLYYEDVDLALRLRERGWNARRAPSLQVVHRAPHHRRAADARTSSHIAASRVRYFRRHRPRLEAAVVTALARLGGLVDRPVSIRHD